MGKIYDSLLNIHKSYMEAQSAIDYKIIKGKGSIILFEEMEIDNSERYYYTRQHEKKIIDCLKIGDFSGIHQVLSDVVENTMDKPLSLNLARCIYFEIINTARKSLIELEPEDYNKIIQQDNILNDIFACQTLMEAFERTEYFYKNICNQINNKKENRKEQFKNDVLSYVRENCCDANLSLSSISDKFSITPVALSRFFTSETQYSFIEFLHRLRISKAKDLLLGTEKNIADIAVNCGYTDSHGFIRSFKKFEGLTPGKYRELYKNKEYIKQQGKVELS